MAGTLVKAVVRAVPCGGVPTMGRHLGLMTSTCAILAWIWDFEPRSSSPLSRSGGFGRRSSSVSAKQAPSRADLPPERQERISRDLASLVPGDTVSVTHYMGDHYGMTQGLVEGLFASDEELVVAGRRIGFRDISAIEVLDG